MGGFILYRGVKLQKEDRSSDIRHSAFREQEFGPGRELKTDYATLLVFPKICASDVENVFMDETGDFCASTGTLIYKRQNSTAGLKLLLNDFRSEGIDWSMLHGNYCVFVGTRNTLHMFTDPIGTYPVWCDREGAVFSNSFPAMVAAIDEKSIDPQSVFEYVFQGSVYGGAALFRELKLFDCKSIATLSSTIETQPLPRPAGSGLTSGDIEEHVSRNVDNLRGYFSAIGACHGDRIDTALSGGYDSRLTLALLQEQGLRPEIHVYGGDNDPDVRIATAIASKEGLTLKHVDKSKIPDVGPDEFPELIRRNFLSLQGYPADGLFENGTDLTTRFERGAGGKLMLNGGGGEVFRNFFYLPDRNYSIRQMLWTFYSRFDPRQCSAFFDEESYYQNLGNKIRETLEIEGTVLRRRDVERLYPEFRCRFWMGRNNGVNNQIGASLTPFIDGNVVPDALNIPLSHKNFGRIEAAMIRAVSPSLARHASVYGHNFAGGVPLKRRLKDLATYLRPPIARRFSYRIQNRRVVQRTPWLGTDYLQLVLDTDFPYMRKFFLIEDVFNNDQFNRICTLEYMFQNVAAILPSEKKLPVFMA